MAVIYEFETKKWAGCNSQFVVLLIVPRVAKGGMADEGRDEEKVVSAFSVVFFDLVVPSY